MTRAQLRRRCVCHCDQEHHDGGSGRCHLCMECHAFWKDPDVIAVLDALDKAEAALECHSHKVCSQMHSCNNALAAIRALDEVK